MFLVEFTSQGITGIWPKYIAEQFGAGVRSAGLGVTYNLGSIAGGLSPLWASALQKSMGLGWALAVLVFSWTLIEAAFVGLDVPGIVRRKTEASLKISY